MLASLLFPYDDDAPKLIDVWIAEIEREGCIARYVVDGTHYIQVLKWLNHQKIDRPTPSRIPQFDESSRVIDESSRVLAADLDLGRDHGPRKGNGEKKEHARKRASLSPMPIDFDLGVSARVKSWAAENGYTRLDEHLANFVTQAQARAYVYSDWDAALMTAIRKDWAQLGARAQTVKPKSRSAQALDTLERLKHGYRKADSDPLATADVPRIGGPAGSGSD